MQDTPETKTADPARPAPGTAYCQDGEFNCLLCGVLGTQAQAAECYQDCAKKASPALLAWAERQYKTLTPAEFAMELLEKAAGCQAAADICREANPARCAELEAAARSWERQATDALLKAGA